MPNRVIAAYAIIAVMAALGIALLLYLSREWRKHRRAYWRSGRSRRARAQARRIAERDALRPGP
ncbi:MAG TPA: hypothetical protein VFW19_03145 [Allosphingosinicella sp.]|nr:hypothetical protein [Allosphingosinicella sp.]